MADSVLALRNSGGGVTESIRACLDAIDSTDPGLNCFRELHREHALAAAERVDERLAGGEDPGVLAGIPVALKDNMVTEFGTTQCGSRILENYHSPYTGTAAQRLMDAGAIVIGKTNCDEFAMGSSTEHCAYGVTRNPWDPERVPGGSSGGSAAAVAARMCPIAMGSDTGGSIRQPASMCSIVGLKPSYGRVSRYGLVAFGSSLDQIGPFAHSVTDAAQTLSVVAGLDTHDSTSADIAVPDYVANLEQPVEGLRLGVPRQYLSDQNDDGVEELITRAIDVYRKLGATIVDVDLPLTRYGVATYYVIAPAEASSNLARFDGIRYGRRALLEPGDDLFDLYARSRAEGFGDEVQRRIMLGTYVLSAGYYDAYYQRALKVRRLIKNEFDAAFKTCDALIGPTSPIPPFKIGAMADPLTLYLCDVYTANTNIAGICGISIPAGFVTHEEQSLPVGLQLQSAAFDEDRLLRIARMFERETDHHTQTPPITVGTAERAG